MFIDCYAHVCIQQCSNVQYTCASDAAHMHNMTSSAHECILAKLVLGTRIWELPLCFELPTGVYMRSEDNSIPMQPLRTSLRLCLLPAPFWKKHMITYTWKQASISTAAQSQSILLFCCFWRQWQHSSSTMHDTCTSVQNTHTLIIHTSSKKLTWGLAMPGDPTYTEVYWSVLMLCVSPHTAVHPAHINPNIKPTSRHNGVLCH